MMRAMTCKGVIDNIPPSDLISGIILPTCIGVAVPSVFLGTNLVFHLSYMESKISVGVRMLTNMLHHPTDYENALFVYLFTV